MYYQAFYRYSDVGADPLPDGIYLRWVQLDGTEGWVETWSEYRHIPDAQHPDIKADGGNCYLVYEKDNGVGCMYSNDNGNSFQTSTVTTNGKHPRVTAIGESVVVSYVRDLDLYTALSDDGGQSWDESSPVNDVSEMVPDQIGTADVSGMHVVWTDDRESDRFKRVYYDQTGFAVPVISIESISGGFGVSAVVKNVGTADATDIDWSIEFEGGVFIGGKTDTIASLAPDQTETIRSGLVLGLGGTEVTVTAGTAVEKVSATVLLFFVLGL
jgi:hypothetical protein